MKQKQLFEKGILVPPTQQQQQQQQQQQSATKSVPVAAPVPVVSTSDKLLTKIKTATAPAAKVNPLIVAPAVVASVFFAALYMFA
eukprot:TRINITY_DN7271_c0_g1_i3.p4 TRINITY_DN7271_c0_g1~~TRINITY_DN7271_c0_g1_i3.p4  ORF type:complete len:85 (+),score=59.10 TRINITY_DN7271_c0_g1_i3:205-459(+)